MALTSKCQILACHTLKATVLKKIIELILHSDSIDCISLINEETFISGSNDGSLGIWNINKKKPVSTVKEAHKREGSHPEATGWINTVSSYHNTDLLASGKLAH